MNIAPGNVMSLTPATPGWDLWVRYSREHAFFMPIVAWAVVCVASEDAGIVTAVEPVIVDKGELFVLREFDERLHDGDHQVKLATYEVRRQALA